MKFIVACHLVLLTAGALADGDRAAHAVAGQTYRCGLRGFWSKLRFAPDGRSFRFENSVGETGGDRVTWLDDGSGRTGDPDDPPFSVDFATNQFAVRGQTCVIDGAAPSGQH